MQPLVLEVVAHAESPAPAPRTRSPGIRRTTHHESSRRSPVAAARPGQRVRASEPARQLVGAPAASAAHWGKGIRDEQDVHRRTLRSAASSARQCAAQLYSRSARARAAAPSRALNGASRRAVSASASVSGCDGS